ncbi:Uncharacterised protein [Corynebacterium renale]|uniref:hypothetical protein n=1 Tax=Corynebacterium renale TaxID=1724 RepID=UPI000DA2C690|nr:hypothetical protein [Corynebacterium renale]SQG65085.1 Uncharacterised protein [Corynebacterium renale]STC97391.1 Uncharacterised protein [Corynebacterium renale]
MRSDYDAFDSINGMLPAEFDREIATAARDAGEPQAGLTSLLDFAYMEGVLTPDILDEVDQLYPDGTVHDYSLILRQKLSA